MIKQFKNVISSYLFLTIFIISLIFLVINYFTYQNSDFKYYSKYDISYSENIDDYDLEIDNLNHMIDSMDEKMLKFEYYKEYYSNKIKIYENLKEDNIDFDTIYDFGYGAVNDKTVYIQSSNSFLLLIITINVLMIIYLAFTREFDDAKYMFVYGSSRRKKLICKLIISFLLVNILFIIYYFINCLFSLKFDSKFQYVLIMGSDINIIKTSFYLFKYNFLYLLYNLWFLFAFLFALAILVKKTIYFVSSTLAIAFLLIVIPNNQNLFSYIGLSMNFEIVSFDFYDITKIAILIPFIFLIFSTYYFEKMDL